MPKMLTIQSNARPACVAASTPTPMLSGSNRNIANAASTSERPSAEASSVETG
jgi:hypothetical protein